MEFRSKMDAFFVKFMVIVMLIIAAASFFPFFIPAIWNEPAEVLIPAIIILTSIFLIVVSFQLWFMFSVKYIFNEDHLFIKGGPFRSRIPYEKITKVTPTTAIFTGHRVLTAKDSIEIFNKTTFMGSIKISPENKKEFLNELRKRNPNVQIEV